MALLKAEHITKIYGQRTIIKDINIELNQGELVCLLGVSGSGKTTLFHILSGLTTPEEGHVYLNDKEITSTPGQISYMLQKDLLLPHKKIIDNVSLPLILKGMKKTDARKKQIHCLQILVWMVHSINIQVSSPAVCVSVQRFCEHICHPTVSRCWTNRFPHWIPLQNPIFISGI